MLPDPCDRLDAQRDLSADFLRALEGIRERGKGVGA
jgi:hypothetical protein